jgi:glycine cleavage system H protein
VKTPAELKYTASHQWVRMETDGTATVGITDFAQEELGDVVFVQHPTAGRKVRRGEDCAVVESVKAASDIFAPVSGEIVEGNAALADAPGDVNAEPMGKGWFFKIKLSNKSELDGLMDEAAYDAFVKTLA